MSTTPRPLDPDVLEDEAFFFDWDAYRAEKAASTQETFWNEYRTSELRRLWQEGVYSLDIGLKLGCSKGAVLGKARRLGLPERCSRTTFKPRNARKNNGHFARVTG